MELEIFKVSSKGANHSIAKFRDVPPTASVGDIKKLIAKKVSTLYPERISLRLEQKSKMLKDSEQLDKLGLGGAGKQAQLYFKDLGPQIGWSTVFLCEYAGPLLCYMISYFRPALIYGSLASNQHYNYSVKLAAACWTFHYVKRILETIFVHRFSHSTMPIMNLFKNCSYYWGFAFYVGYFVNHPLYTPAVGGSFQVYLALAGFILAEFGNLSIHVALRNLRPPGTKERRIPKPTSNPFTILFHFVSCPNYTYEVASWLCFTAMTQALPAFLFTVAGGFQMWIWAKGKHRNYLKEFPDYPRSRKAMIPFLS